MNFLHRIVRQIESIKFAMDWKMQDRLAGVKRFKADFMQSAFAGQTGKSLPLELETPTAMAEFDKFKVRQNHIVTSRTYLHDLYVEVSSRSAILQLLTSA